MSGLTQDYNINFSTYSEKDGLAGSIILDFHEDKKGFVWIATKDGISRFDGKTFKNFFQEKNDLHSNSCVFLSEDVNGYIWPAFLSKEENVNVHFHIYHPLISPDFQIKSIQEVYGDIMPFDASQIRFVTMFEHNILYMTLKSGRIFKFDGSFTEIPSNPICANMNIKKIEPNGDIWLHRYKTLIRINAKGELVEQESIFDSRNNLGSNKGKKWRTDYFQNEVFSHIIISPIDSLFNGLLDNHLKHRKISSTGNIVFSRKKSPLGKYYIVKTKTNLILLDEEKRLIHDFTDALMAEFDGLNIGAKYLLRKNQIWFENGKGFCIINYQLNPFRNYLKEPSSNSVRGIVRHKPESFLVNAERGLTEVNIGTGEINNDIPKGGTYTWGLIKKSDGLYFSGYYGALISEYNARKKEYRFIFPGENEDVGRKAGGFLVPYKDKNDQVWVGTLNGLFLYDEKGDSLIIFKRYNNHKSLKLASINHFFEDEKVIWLGTSNGLYVLDYEKGITDFFEPTTDLPIYHFYKDGDLFWLATYGKGLVKWNRKTAEIEQFGKKDGFLNENLTAIYPDANNHLWIATEEGIVRFNKKTNAIHVFLESDGITHNEFNRGSHFQDEDGNIYFGGLNGVNVFHPDSLKETKESIHPFRITDYFELNNKTGVFEEKTSDIIEKGKIHLKPNIKSFKIHFELLNFQNTDQTRYAYKIEGFDENWTYQNENFIRINTLPQGDYALKIKAQSYQGLWMPEIISLPLTVEVPFYEMRSWRILMLVGLLSLIFLIYKWEKFLAKNRENRLAEMVKERTKIIADQKKELEILNETKNRLFSIIGHDLKDPVIAFKGLSQKIAFLIQKNDSKRILDLGTYIEKEAQYLHDLLDNLLHWALSQRNEIKTTETSVSLYPIIEKIIANNQHIQELAGIELKNEVPKQLNVMSDRPILETVFRNLISNALKHTKEGGYIRVSCEVREEVVQINVEDSGVGMNTQQLENLFEIQHNKSENRQISFGLHLCKELLQILNGKIEAKSTEGVGTVFKITLPKGT
jgi:signal transduction histidine kinase